MPADVLKLLSAASRLDPGPVSDPDLLARFVASREEAAFAELVRRHGPAVYRTCKHLLGPSSADDAFQATFLVLACRAKSVRKVGSVGSWLIGVAGRVSRQMRKSLRRAAGVSRLMDENAGGSGQQQGAPPASHPRSPEFAELATILDEELSRLPDSLRAPVVLCLVEGQTQEQAAAALGGSVRTLRRRLDRAKALLRLRLERRGVVPTVAAGLVVLLGSGTAALPPGLAERTVNGVFAFLTGGGPVTTAAIVAKGVVGNMASIKASVLVAAMAAVVIGLGVGWADDGPPPAAPPNIPLTPPRATAGDRIPPPVAQRPADYPPPSNGQSANFAVSAPTEVMARVIANEAEYQREEIAERWLGKKLPDWPRCSIRVTGENRKGGATAIQFHQAVKLGLVAHVSAEMELHGPFEYVLTTALPHEVTHTVLAAYFGKPVPRWADEGIAQMSEPPEEQVRFDARCRELVQDGKALRLRAMFPMMDFPDFPQTFRNKSAQIRAQALNQTRALVAIHAQGHSVCRFLVGRMPRMIVDGEGKVMGEGKVRKCPTEFLLDFNDFTGSSGLTAFVQLGMDGNTPDSWAKAAKEVYEFASVDDLEAAWLDWLKTPESKLGGSPAPKPADPNLSPPTKLPGGEGKLPDDVIRVTSRTQTFPIKPGLDREKNAKEVHLYVSHDRGATWQKQAIALPDQAAFVFEAPTDGLYWFTVVIVTTDGRTIPADLSRLEPMQKILVDTGREGKR